MSPIKTEVRPPSQPSMARAVRAWLIKARRSLSARLWSSLIRRIVVLNLAGLLAMFLGFLYLNQFREGLIEARIQSLLTQGEIIASAIASSATVDTDAINIDPDKLLQMQAGETMGLGEDVISPLDFSINPETVTPLLRRLVTPTRTRARVYDREGVLLVDSRNLYGRGDISRFDLPPPGSDEDVTLLERTWSMFKGRLGRAELPSHDELAFNNGKSLNEVARALQGQPGAAVRFNARGQTIVSVAVPVQRQKAVKGTLLLSTQGDDIDQIVSTERVQILMIFLVAAAVMTLMSILLANTIAQPIRKLAAGAMRVQRRIQSRAEIPDFTDRADEIGHLSGSLRSMTGALYSRIEAIESFAADVAHELKNPLTSLRSAVDTLPLARTEESRNRLLDVIRHDVKRLDRLITDISEASRLDADMARNDEVPVELARLLETVISVQNELQRAGQPPIMLELPEGAAGLRVIGHESRLGQVLVNLLENARSFSPPDGTVRVRLKPRHDQVDIIVEDDGPGIPSHALERIFERFYTDRPDQSFGQNSGLGLSISRQIVEGHGGTIRAENRTAPGGATAGARFTVTLPLLPAPAPARKAKG
jgi:two-component system, OmpR family, sensor histidine kinase ChvG